jgi:hypothetical protein
LPACKPIVIERTEGEKDEKCRECQQGDQKNEESVFGLVYLGCANANVGIRVFGTVAPKELLISKCCQTIDLWSDMPHPYPAIDVCVSPAYDGVAAISIFTEIRLLHDGMLSPGGRRHQTNSLRKRMGAISFTTQMPMLVDEHRPVLRVGRYHDAFTNT